MINLLFGIPRQVVVAFSGGVDSTAIVDFLSNKHDISCAFFHHKTENSDKAYEFVSKFCTDRNLTLIVHMLNSEKPKELSQEEFWRNERYKFLESINLPVITAHHLDDCVETYIWSCLHGTPKVIPAQRNNIIRPFLTTKKSELVDWCLRKKVKWCDDYSNNDTAYTRNFIRKELVPKALIVNPGLHKTVKKIVEKNL